MRFCRSSQRRRRPQAVRQTRLGNAQRFRDEDLGVRPGWAEVDLSAIAHNVELLCDAVAPARLCAVVKADGYGHGAVEVGRTALAAGAEWLAVAMVEEGAALRQAGIDSPMLVLSEPPAEDLAAAVAQRLVPAVYTSEGIEATAKAVAMHATEKAPYPVHLKVDTGMHRVGADPERAVDLARQVADRPELCLAGLWTHCAMADQPDDPFTDTQLGRFAAVTRQLEAAGLRPPLRHAANSAVAIAHPAGRLDLVRCGIAVYGIAPSPALAGHLALRPALSLKAVVSQVRSVAAGEGASYGLVRRFPTPTTLATVPLGYADGVRRALSSTGGEVLIGGRRRPLAGTVSMDQIVVDCGDDQSVRAGDEVVLIGRQGDEEVTVDEWADRLGTIGYEVVCGIGARVPIRYRRGLRPHTEEAT